jgi:hypothetical protein
MTRPITEIGPPRVRRTIAQRQSAICRGRALECPSSIPGMSEAVERDMAARDEALRQQFQREEQRLIQRAEQRLQEGKARRAAEHRERTARNKELAECRFNKVLRQGWDREVDQLTGREPEELPAHDVGRPANPPEQDQVIQEAWELAASQGLRGARRLAPAYDYLEAYAALDGGFRPPARDSIAPTYYKVRKVQPRNPEIAKRLVIAKQVRPQLEAELQRRREWENMLNGRAKSRPTRGKRSN